MKPHTIEELGLQGFVLALEQEPEDQASLCAAVDHLLIHDIGLDQVVRLYAGAPPNWHYPYRTQRALWRMLGLYCKQTSPESRRNLDMPSECISGTAHELLDRFLFARGSGSYVGRLLSHAIEDAYQADPTHMNSPEWLEYALQHKQDILRLFPDVEWTVEQTLPWVQPAEKWLAPPVPSVSGFRLDMPYSMTKGEREGMQTMTYKQTLAAPDWMEPRFVQSTEISFEMPEAHLSQPVED